MAAVKTTNHASPRYLLKGGRRPDISLEQRHKCWGPIIREYLLLKIEMLVF
jgi:hypothetical protein